MKHQEVIQKICKLWQISNTVLLTAASNFDGDALGCVYALAEFGQRQGKKMIIANEKPVTKLYSFVTPPVPVVTVFPVEKVDMIVVCDTGSLEMLGSLYLDNIEKFGNIPTVNIDHHNSCYGNVCWSTCSYENTSATMMIDCFIRMLDSEGITPSIATYLLLGLYFDTECYRNLNTTSHGLRFGASMIEKGADHALLMRHLYQSTPKNYVRLYGEVLSDLREVGNGKGVIAIVTQELFEKHGVNPDYLGNELVNHFLRSIDAEFMVLIKDCGRERRMSFRSKSSEYDMRDIAGIFGGGGHDRASGASSEGGVMECIQKITDFFHNSELVVPRE